MCKCNHQAPAGVLVQAEGAAPELGEMGMLKLTASGAERVGQWGPSTGTYYPFDQQATLWVDRRDAIYLVGQDLRFA